MARSVCGAKLWVVYRYNYSGRSFTLREERSGQTRVLPNFYTDHKRCRRSESAQFMKAVIQKSGLKHTQISLTVLPTMLGQLFACCMKDRCTFTTGKPKVEQLVLLQCLEQLVPLYIRKVGRFLGFLAAGLSDSPIPASWHFCLIANNSANVVSFLQAIKPNPCFRAKDRSESAAP
jgi:hypothetical protein